MAVYYKFKSAKDYDSIPIDGHFISVANLKEKIFESKHLGRGTDFDLVVTNAQTNEEYLNEATLVPKNTSVLIRRVPGQPRIRIHTSSVSEQEETMVDYNKPEEEPAKSSFVGADLSIPKYPDDSEWDEFGNDLYAMPEVLPVQSTNPVLDAPAPSKADEDSKIKALIDTPALDWQHQPSDGFGLGRGFGRSMGGRMMGGRGFGRGGGGLGGKTPPQGYICHRCKVPGHFIQHCPTNGDPNFDVKRVKPPTGIPKSMLMATPDGSYALPSGAVAVLKPNEAAFEKEIEGMPSSRPVGEFPQELRCPLCKEGMKDAVLTSKCCFKSFCDKCIRDYIISRSACVCGATNILADDLLPNKTLRDTINRLLESNNNNSSAENGGSAFQVQDMESARCPQPKVPSPAQSGVSSKGETAKISASKGEPGPTQIEDTSNIRQPSLEQQDKGFVVSAPQQNFEKRDREVKIADVSEATHESRSMKEPVSHGSAPMVDEEVQQKALSGEAGKKKKKKKIRMPTSGEMQWRNPQEFAPENYMMPMGPPPPPYNPFWNGMPGGMDGYLGGPYPGPMPPYMGFGFGPMDVPFGGVLPPDPFAAQGYMMPPFMPPQRDLADFGMGLNGGPPIMSREEFEARKADLKRKREMEQRRGRSGREFPNDREFSREMSSTGDISSMKLKSSKSNIPPPQRPTGEQQRHRSSPERHQEPPRESSKRKSEYYDDEEPDYHRDRQHHHSHHRSESGRPPVEPPPSKSAAAAAAAAADAADRKLKASVFSRISFPEREEASSAGVPKKRKVVSEPPAEVEHHSHRASVNGYREEHHKSSASMSRKSASVVEYESSDEDRHFKRRPSRYESSPVEESGRHSRGSRDRVRDERDRSGHSKHR